MKAEDAVHEIELGEVTVERLRPPLASEIVAAIIEPRATLGRSHARIREYLLRRIQRYLAERCFGEPVDLESDVNRIFLGEPEVQEQIARVLGAKLGRTGRPRSSRLRLRPNRFGSRDTQRIPLASTARRLRKDRLQLCGDLQSIRDASSREFLDACDDVLRFAALAEFFTGFWVDYVKPSGATGRYFPDWVVVQQLDGAEANWIVETKGRVWEGPNARTPRSAIWCEQVTALSGESWRYLRVDQPIFKPETLEGFAKSAALIEGRVDDVEQQVDRDPGSSRHLWIDASRPARACPRGDRRRTSRTIPTTSPRCSSTSSGQPRRAFRGFRRPGSVAIKNLPGMAGKPGTTTAWRGKGSPGLGSWSPSSERRPLQPRWP